MVKGRHCCGAPPKKCKCASTWRFCLHTGEVSATGTLGTGSLSPALPVRSPEGLCLSHWIQVAQSSVPVGMEPRELGTGCAYDQGEWGWGALGSSVAGCCLGDQILSQKAAGLARQSPGAQHWVPGGLEEVDGVPNGVCTRVNSTPNNPLKASLPSGTLRRLYVAVTCIHCSSLARRMWV